MQKLTISAADKYELSALYARPVGDSIGSIILSPATGIKKEFYISFAQYLVQNGYCVLLYDYRGIGESPSDDSSRLSSCMYEWGMLDMNAVLEYMVREKAQKNIIWIGHGVGAEMVGFVENSQYIHKVIAISSAAAYWNYFTSTFKWKIWGLWFFTGPFLAKLYGPTAMRNFGWSENLSPNMMKEQRRLRLDKMYFTRLLKSKINKDKFYGFTIPIKSVYMSDDHFANDKTIPAMMNFFPDSPKELYKIPVEKYTNNKVGHSGIFQRTFQNNLWPLLMNIMFCADHGE